MSDRSLTHGPLDGLRIVEFDAIGPVPLAAMILADMGADIVRITRPRTGGEAWDEVGGAVLHRGRAAVEIDLATDADRALSLIAGADAALEGFRPGVMERLGLGPQPCLAANPALVYGRMTGWGQDGPLAQRAGHDLNYLALTGALHAIGPAEAPPPVPLNLIGDYGGGTMFLVAGVLAAVLSARDTGQGQVVDAAMVDGVSCLSALFHAFRASGAWSDERQNNLLDGGAPFYRTYRCADGRFVAVGALEPKFYRSLLDGLDLELSHWPQMDRALWPSMAETFAARFATRPRDEWARTFEGTDACVTPVLDWAEAADNAHLGARGTLQRGKGAVQPAPAPRFSATPSSVRPAQTLSFEEASRRWDARERLEEAT